MTITELINELESLKNKHGNVDAGMFVYDGGYDALYGVRPVFDKQLNLVVMQNWDTYEVYR